MNKYRLYKENLIDEIEADLIKVNEITGQISLFKGSELIAIYPCDYILIKIEK